MNFRLSQTAFGIFSVFLILVAAGFRNGGKAKEQTEKSTVSQLTKLRPDGQTKKRPILQWTVFFFEMPPYIYKENGTWQGIVPEILDKVS